MLWGTSDCRCRDWCYRPVESDARGGLALRASPILHYHTATLSVPNLQETFRASTIYATGCTHLNLDLGIKTLDLLRDLWEPSEEPAPYLHYMASFYYHFYFDYC